MLPGGALLGALGLNFLQHKRGKPTLCSTARSVLPGWAIVGGWLVLTVWFIQHILDGYTVEIDLSDLKEN